MESISDNNNINSEEKNHKMYTTDGEIVLIPYSEVTTKFLPLQIVKAIEYNQNQNEDMIIKTSVTSKGLEYVRSFKRTGFWPLEATAKSAIIPDFEFSEAIDYLMIDEQPIFSLYYLSQYLLTVENKSLEITIICSDNGAITLKLYEIDRSILEVPDSSWNRGIMYSFFPNIQHISKNIEIHVSFLYEETEEFLFLNEEEYSETFCEDCHDGFCDACQKYQNKCYCHRCKKCNAYNDNGCSCDDLAPEQGSEAISPHIADDIDYYDMDYDMEHEHMNPYVPAEFIYYI